MSQPGPRELPAARVNRAAKAMYKQLREAQGMADLWKDLKPETRFAWRDAFIAGLYAFDSNERIAPDDGEA